MIIKNEYIFPLIPTINYEKRAAKKADLECDGAKGYSTVPETGVWKNPQFYRG